MTASKRLFSGTKIACQRGGRMLFQNLSFALDPGDIAHLAGPNGAGKTSLLRLMCGALPLAGGKIQWDGHDFLASGMPAHAARTAFLPADDRGLKSLETAGENLRFWSNFLRVPSPRTCGERVRVRGGTASAVSTSMPLTPSSEMTLSHPRSPQVRGEGEEAWSTALKKMDILDLADTPVRRLSAGQRRRLSLARVLLRPAKLWLLDEPLNGLDMKSYDLFMDALDAHCKTGGMAVLASHYAVQPLTHGHFHRIEVGYK